MAPSAPGPHRPADPLPPALQALTFVSGLQDAASFLGLGHVFTANMTGNILVLGFSAAGAPGFSISRTATSLGGFVIGTLLGGRLGVAMAGLPRHRWVGCALSAEAVLDAVAAVVAATVAGVGRDHTVIALLAVAMGIRNATVRRLAVPDLTTTVVTRTLTGLIADSSVAGGSNPRMGRRLLTVLAMVAGAAVGASLVLHQGVAVGLAATAGSVAAVVLAHELLSRTAAAGTA
ncbi:YoaK family protein [Peterkaempfera griseoplana]|uniref:YoaK family protein n=1 Tax=Peterkaempfera griseoplana TaxID=66896 RepID=UPI0006E2597B|nr:YoaK family protein [Peterkaempfera griseoplana]